MEFVSLAGPWRYPILAVSLCMVAAIVRASIACVSTDPLPPAGPPHHAIVAWGVLGAIVGLAGTVVGFGRLAVGARQAAGTDLDALVEIMLDGMLVIVAPVTLGLGLLTASLLAWLLMGFALNRRRVESSRPSSHFDM